MSHQLNPKSIRPHEISPSIGSRIENPIPSYFMVADILGFSKMIQNLNGSQQAQRVSEWMELVQETGLQAGIKEMQLISDTLFVREEDSVDGLARILRFAQQLLERGVERSFLLRGAIVHGGAAWGKLPFGQAIIGAHRMEESLDWVGIACAPNIPKIESMWDWDLVAVYPVPQKAGVIQLSPAVSWRVPSTEVLVHKASENGLMTKGDPYRWDVISKLERAIQFGIYLKIGKSNRLDPKRYCFWLPMHFIEQRLGPSE